MIIRLFLTLYVSKGLNSPRKEIRYNKNLICLLLTAEIVKALY